MRDEKIVVGALPGTQNWLKSVLSDTQPDFRIVILNADTAELSHLTKTVLRETEAAVIWAVPSADQQTISQAVKAGAAGVLFPEMSKVAVICLLRFAAATWRHTAAYKKQAEQALQDLADRKQVERAKGILMERFSLSEVDAYQIMRREAMNSRKSMAQLAEGIVLMKSFDIVLN